MKKIILSITLFSSFLMADFTKLVVEDKPDKKIVKFTLIDENEIKQDYRMDRKLFQDLLSKHNKKMMKGCGDE
ncbi:MAG: hypothetical protein Q8J85_07285 [Sulfuricurvum sp.]|nr:hypothetical protein [Sulfuricurvum sp.]MDP3022970.1 hypothetical protein [Sulfuricurvum sp.]